MERHLMVLRKSIAAAELLLSVILSTSARLYFVHLPGFFLKSGLLSRQRPRPAGDRDASRPSLLSRSRLRCSGRKNSAGCLNVGLARCWSSEFGRSKSDTHLPYSIRGRLPVCARLSGSVWLVGGLMDRSSC